MSRAWLATNFFNRAFSASSSIYLAKDLLCAGQRYSRCPSSLSRLPPLAGLIRTNAAFLKAIGDHGITFTSDQAAINIGHAVCQELSEGMSEDVPSSVVPLCLSSLKGQGLSTGLRPVVLLAFGLRVDGIG
jgi:hypothetical protein